MSSKECKLVRDALALGAVPSEYAQHLGSCAECSRFAATLSNVREFERNLPQASVGSAAIQSLLTKVQNDQVDCKIGFYSKLDAALQFLFQNYRIAGGCLTAVMLLFMVRATLQSNNRAAEIQILDSSRDRASVGTLEHPSPESEPANSFGDRIDSAMGRDTPSNGRSDFDYIQQLRGGGGSSGNEKAGNMSAAGVAGMEGVLIDPIGKAVAGAATSGPVSGISEGYGHPQTGYNSGRYGGNEIVSDDPLIYAAGKGASGAANAMSQIVKDRMQHYVPHVKVYSGREGTAVFSKSITMEPGTLADAPASRKIDMIAPGDSVVEVGTIPSPWTPT